LAAFLVTRGGKSRWEKLSRAVTASTLALMFAQPLGLAIQAYVTTSSNVTHLAIGRVTCLAFGGIVVHSVQVVSG